METLQMENKYKVESPANQMSKDETMKEKNNDIKGSFKKIIKRIRVNIKIKKLIRGQTKILNWRVKLNWKITLTIGKTNQKNEG